MIQLRSSREISERVEIESQRRPNLFRRRTWWGAFWLSVLSAAWLGYEGARGEYHIFEGGELSQPHRMFENDCAKCHTTWAPVDRVLSLDFSDRVYSVENATCESCHPGSEHHRNQVPAHRELSCASCHDEHNGDVDLKRITDSHCVACHGDLKTSDGSSGQFDPGVTSFSDFAGHPPFAFERLLARNDGGAQSRLAATGDELRDHGPIGARHGARSVLSFTDERGWHDGARIRFNHAAHLKSERDGEGNLVYGLIGRDQRLSNDRFTDLSQTCDVCHKENADGRYMEPIQFEQHCRECHPLLFDNRRFPQEQVPHESLDLVLGFLTQKYTLEAINGESVPRSVPPRPIPGSPGRNRLTTDQAAEVAQRVNEAEQLTLRHTHALFGPEAKGGCVYCHDVEDAGSPGGWNIAPPKIPSVWQPHARFSHHSHRLLNCAECHKGVDQSRDTADVLLPGIESCRMCHSDKPERSLGSQSSTLVGARSDCVECHVYHDHSKDNFTGQLNLLLEKSDRTLTGSTGKGGSK